MGNLAIAVFCGLFFTSVRFAWQSQKPLEIAVESPVETPMKIYRIKGSLFFATKDKLASAFTVDTDPRIVEIDFARAKVFDFSVLHAFYPILERYAEKGIEVHISNLKNATHIHNLLRFGAVQGRRKAEDGLSLLSAGDKLSLLSPGEDEARCLAQPG